MKVGSLKPRREATNLCCDNYRNFTPSGLPTRFFDIFKREKNNRQLAFVWLVPAFGSFGAESLEQMCGVATVGPALIPRLQHRHIEGFAKAPWARKKKNFRYRLGNFSYKITFVDIIIPLLTQLLKTRNPDGHS